MRNKESTIRLCSFLLSLPLNLPLRETRAGCEIRNHGEVTDPPPSPFSLLPHPLPPLCNRVLLNATLQSTSRRPVTAPLLRITPFDVSLILQSDVAGCSRCSKNPARPYVCKNVYLHMYIIKYLHTYLQTRKHLFITYTCVYIHPSLSERLLSVCVCVFV